VNLEIENLENQLAETTDKLLEIKDLVETLCCMWDSGSFYPDAERVINELRDLTDSIDI
jgi:hypothetical protein|tara:strand:- start:345 stop:521 length:177 start_codon:yes stop_codon:yes gene_type:complete